MSKSQAHHIAYFTSEIPVQVRGIKITEDQLENTISKLESAMGISQLPYSREDAIKEWINSQGIIRIRMIEKKEAPNLEIHTYEEVPGHRERLERLANDYNLPFDKDKVV